LNFHHGLLGRALVGGIVVWGLWLPLSDVLRYPDRLSVVPNLETDAAAYYAFARDFASSWQLSALPSKHPPGWMVLLAGVRVMAGDSYIAGKVVSWAALVLTVSLSAWLARRVYGPTAAAIAAVLCATSPGLRAYVGTLQYEVVTGALFVLLLVLSTRVGDAKTRREAIRRASLAGMAGAALVLTRETFVLVVPIVTWWIWRQLQRTIGRESALVAAIALIVVAASPALVWSAVQTRHHKRLILISEKGPKEFQLGNNPLANGTYNETLVGIAEPSGFAYVRAFPSEALLLAARKVLYFFGVLRDGWNVPHPPAVWIWRTTTGAVPLAVIEPIVRGGWLLVICLIALYMLGREQLRSWCVLPATVAAILIVHVVTLASYRFAIPLLPVLYVIASGPLAAAARAAVPVLRVPIIAVTCVLIVGLAVAAQYQSWPLQTSYDAVDLDGIAAANEVDAVSGLPARVASARMGERPVVLLPDTYLSRGPLTLTVRMRRTNVGPSDATAVARIALRRLDGQLACVEDVSGAQLQADRFAEVVIQCRLVRDGPATLAIYSLGHEDLAISDVSLRWN
jgi:hypothetical protein